MVRANLLPKHKRINTFRHTAEILRILFCHSDKKSDCIRLLAKQPLFGCLDYIQWNAHSAGWVSAVWCEAHTKRTKIDLRVTLALKTDMESSCNTHHCAVVGRIRIEFRFWPPIHWLAYCLLRTFCIFVCCAQNNGTLLFVCLHRHAEWPNGSYFGIQAFRIFSIVGASEIESRTDRRCS